MNKKSYPILLLILLIFMCGCGSEKDSVIKLDIQKGVFNLDPQFATEENSRLILMNIFEGLVIQSPQGEILPGCAYSWDVSPDNKTYTFHLKDNLFWNDSENTPLTAEDFAFGITRLFSSGARSPYAQDFSSIENAPEYLAGESSATPAVYATDKNTLVIRLGRVDPMILQKLSTPAAYPCNRSFFNKCKGRYGLELKFTQSNGPFSLDTWNNEKYILLRKNTSYHDAQSVNVQGVNLYIARGDSFLMFSEGKSNVSAVPASYIATVPEKTPYTYSSFDTSWCIVFNNQSPMWKSVFLRQSMAAAVDRAALGSLPANLRHNSSVLTSQSFIGKSTIADVDDKILSIKFNPQEATRLFELGAERIGLSEKKRISILVPEGSPYKSIGEAIALSWQENLPLYASVKEEEMDELARHYQSGDFDVILYPLKQNAGQAYDLLSRFSSESGINYSQYTNPIYDEFLISIGQHESYSEMANAYIRALNLLISDAPVIPLLEEAQYYSSSFSDIWIYPFSGNMYFKYAA